jgi:hypothetical protein
VTGKTDRTGPRILRVSTAGSSPLVAAVVGEFTAADIGRALVLPDHPEVFRGRRVTIVGRASPTVVAVDPPAEQDSTGVSALVVDVDPHGDGYARREMHGPMPGPTPARY